MVCKLLNQIFKLFRSVEQRLIYVRVGNRSRQPINSLIVFQQEVRGCGVTHPTIFQEDHAQTFQDGISSCFPPRTFPAWSQDS
jgi:hypothetical protein